MDSQVIGNSLKGIAVIGMAGRFPGAKSIEQFWQNLCDGVESISFFSDDELLASGVDSVLLNDPNYVKAGAVVEDIEMFDAQFFDFSPREAEVMDPQHRVFLECAWEALENAGYAPEADKWLTGVYAGGSASTYLINNLISSHELINSLPPELLLISNDKDYIPTRVSYKLNLHGPSFNVSTACSTSLVAVHLACRGLLSYECDLALAGGITIQVPQKGGYLYQAGGMSPHDGHCRAFDAKAQGTIFGDGVGIVVLKRLEDALADGDCIQAVIKGSAINNDGSLKVSYTAPSVDGQVGAIAESQAIAGFHPETITYIEAHGTGTDLGDPIEIRALEKVFRASTQKKGFCGIGSVKTNIGHTNSASGVTNLIKTVLALKHKMIPPTLHFENPNPQIDLANSPFYVNTKLSDWKTNGTPRRAGVSAFGLGGTNAHVTLEEAPVIEPSSTSRPWQLLMLSAKTSSALDTATVNLAEHLKQHRELNLADVAYTLEVGRRKFEHRRAVVCQDIEDAVSALTDPKRVLTSIEETSERPVAFMFTGLGTHYVNMAWELYLGEPVFREQVDRCCDILKPLLDLDLRDLLYPNRNQNLEGFQPPNSTKNTPASGLDLRKMLGRDQEPANEATQKLNQTYLTQPAIFVIEYSLAQLWISWGIRPVAMIGYSIGEYVAATLAGVLSIEDALTLVAKRAQMIQDLPGGAMLAVPLSTEEVRPFLGEKLSLSAINGAKLCVIAGETDAVEQLASQLTEKGLACRRLQTSHAFHSQMMEPIASDFTELVKTVSLKPPQIPYLSNVTGTWITEAEATDPSYWTKHLCQPVRFAEGVNELWKQQQPILLEVGPGQTLGSFALQCLENEPLADKVVLPSLRDAYNQRPDLAFLLNTLGQLWLSGVEIDWSKFYTNERRHRLPLPTYPFERQRYWIEPAKNQNDFNLNQGKLEQKLDIKDWFYIPSWKQVAPPVSFEPEKLITQKQCWLVFVDTCGIGPQIVKRLESENQDVIVVRVGEQFGQLNEREYTINPGNTDDYDALLKAICELNKTPQTIAHLWNITPNQHISSRLECLEKTQELGFYSLLLLAQALGKQNITDSLQIGIVSNNMQELLGEEELFPEKATLLGLCKVIPQEYSNITCRSIDITLPQSGTRQWQQLIDQLLAEIATETSEQVIAYRGNHRWVQDFEPLPIKDKTLRKNRLRKGGVYVITGGLGKLGLIVSEYLAKTVPAKLVLIGRSGLPPKAEWTQWLSSHDEQNPLSTKIRKVQALEELGAEVLVIEADVSNLEQMQAMVKQVGDRFGEINGVFHLAGAAGGSFIQATSPETASSILEPKVKGTLVLDYALKDAKPDFWVLFSSIASILGGLGQADYCAANSFLDAFAHDNFFRQETFTVSVNWDGWQENNLQDELLSSYGPEILADLKEFREKYSITSQEGAEALEYILSSTVPQVVVSTQNLHDQIESMQDEFASLLQTSEKYLPKSIHQRPNLKTAYVPPSNDVERKITGIYQELLAIESVGINDNFFDLGGNSLIGTQLLSKLRQDFQIELPFYVLFETPTVAQLALAIEKIIIGELEELTEEEAQELVSNISSQ